MGILNVRKDTRLQASIDTYEWITCHLLAAHAPDLNPVECIGHYLMRALRQGLGEIQSCSTLIDGCLAETGLTLTTSLQQGQ